MMDNMVPVSVSLISACIKEKGFPVALFDTTCYRTAEKSGDEIRVENLQVRPFNLADSGVQIKETDVYEYFYRKVINEKPGLIAASVVEPNFYLAIGLLKKIKALKISNIIGGTHAVMDPQGLISNEYVDMVCTGEGEELICEVLNRISSV